MSKTVGNIKNIVFCSVDTQGKESVCHVDNFAKNNEERIATSYL